MKKNSAPFGASDKDIEAAGKALGKVMRSKGKKKYFLLALIVIVAVVAALTKTGVLPDVVGTGETVTAAPASSAADTLEVNYIDVGQGDCTLIICGGQTMLIDAGENGHEEKVISYLHSKGVGKLDYLVCSHQHTDHMGGLPEVLDEFGASTVIMPRLTKAQTPTNKTYTAFLNSVKASGAKVEAAQPGNSYTLGSAKFEILGPVTDDAESLNNMSAVLMLTFEGKNFSSQATPRRRRSRRYSPRGAGLTAMCSRSGITAPRPLRAPISLPPQRPRYALSSAERITITVTRISRRLSASRNTPRRYTAPISAAI